CDGCHMDPILGTRFLCMNCDESREVDLCEDCMIEGKFENGKYEHHKKSHRFSAIVNPTSQRFDMDHVPEQVDEYNYLDATPAEQ
ncbi:10647_t:CDS:2, partial [Racocetra fulgida]